MRGYREAAEQEFFSLFRGYFDSEKDAGKQHDPANYSLDRMFPLAALAGNPERKLQIIHIAGTKGKGSTSHYISSLLQACGQQVGLFTSPHLATVRERFQINNQLIPYDQLIAAGREFCQQLVTANLQPSLFEIFTILALKIFAETGLHWVVLETGIGGRLDASNYIADPICTVITPISYDHMALLGSSIPSIAAEKAGILKHGCPLVLSTQPFPEAERVLLDRAAELGLAVHRPQLLPPEGILPAAYPPFLKSNFAVALKVIQVLGLVPDWDIFCLPELRARCEVIQTNPLVILDAAHNADSMQKLVAALQTLYPGTRFTVVLGIVQGKDVAGMVEALKMLTADFILTNPHTKKGSALPQLRECAEKAGLKIFAIIDDLREKSQLPTNCPLLFTGSFFTAVIGEKFFSPAEEKELE
ncbi:MAG: cyanophycin synthetase [Lentisphaeria bacterium]